MSIASYAAAGIEVTNMQARALDARHVVVEEDAFLHDSHGEPIRDHERVDFLLVSADSLECTVTDDYYRQAATGAVAQVVYRGALRRLSSAEAEQQIEEMKQHGLTEKAAVQAPVARK
jgi:hypothetical protein